MVRLHGHGSCAAGGSQAGWPADSVGNSPVLILVLLIDAAHQRGRRRQDLVNEDEDGLLRGELDPLADDVDELADGEVCWYQVLLLVDGRDVALFDFLADDLDGRPCQRRWGPCLRGRGGERQGGSIGDCPSTLPLTDGRFTARTWMVTYRNAVRVLLADALSLGLALLEGVLVLELGSHGDGEMIIGLGKIMELGTGR